MALMPEDLLNKRFTPVRFTEGYDMDEVDNYLDNDVMPRLQELIDENSKLQRELEEAHNRIAELEQSRQEGAGEVLPASDADVPAESGVAVPDEMIPDESATATDEQVEPQSAVVAEEPAPEQAPPTPAGPDQTAAGIIALAHRLHDEHVRNGEEERDRLIAEANAEHRRIVGEAEETSRSTLERLESERSELEKSIEGLRTFERDYRNRLRNYLENQLRELDTDETQDQQSTFGL